MGGRRGSSLRWSVKCSESGRPKRSLPGGEAAVEGEWGCVQGPGLRPGEGEAPLGLGDLGRWSGKAEQGLMPARHGAHPLSCVSHRKFFTMV